MSLRRGESADQRPQTRELYNCVTRCRSSSKNDIPTANFMIFSLEMTGQNQKYMDVETEGGGGGTPNILSNKKLKSFKMNTCKSVYSQARTQDFVWRGSHMKKWDLFIIALVVGQRKELYCNLLSFAILGVSTSFLEIYKTTSLEYLLIYIQIFMRKHIILYTNDFISYPSK